MNSQSQIFLIKNNKGGVGKSFLTSQIGHALTLCDQKVLILTSDSQNNIFDFFKGLEIPTYKEGLKSWITKGEGDIIKLRENLFFIPVEDVVFGNNLTGKFNVFIEKMRKEYDYILIDSVPTLKVDELFLSIADKFIIPTYCDKIATRMLLNFIDEIDINKLHSIVINKYIATQTQLQWKSFLEEQLQGKIDLFVINQFSDVEKMIEKGKTIFETRTEKTNLIQTQKELIRIVESIINKK